MNERRLRTYVDDLELTAALLAYANTVDLDVDGDGDGPPKPTPPTLSLTNVIPLRRPSPPRKPK